MIKPTDNLRAMQNYSSALAFPPLGYLHLSMLARHCYALVSTDRYLARCDEKRNAEYQRLISELQKEWSRLRIGRISGSVLTDYRIIRRHAARLLKDKK